LFIDRLPSSSSSLVSWFLRQYCMPSWRTSIKVRNMLLVKSLIFSNWRLLSSQLIQIPNNPSISVANTQLSVSNINTRILKFSSSSPCLPYILVCTSIYFEALLLMHMLVLWNQYAGSKQISLLQYFRRILHVQIYCRTGVWLYEDLTLWGR